MRYPVVIHHDKESDSAYGVTIPDMPGCFTAGDTMEGALANIQEAVELYLEDQDAIPAPSRLEDLVGNPDYAGGVWLLADVDTSALGKAKRINITVPERALREIDAFAERKGMNRSAFLTKAALEAIQRG